MNLLFADEDIPAGACLTTLRFLGIVGGVEWRGVGRSMAGLGPLGVADRDYRKGEIVTPVFAAVPHFGPEPPPSAPPLSPRSP